MALYLNTGTPGAGKTLFTLWTVEQRRVRDNKAFEDAWVLAGSDPANPPLIREVYYFNINIKKLPWIKLDKPEDWLGKPSGSIFVFDECQEAFPPRSNSSTPPIYVSELAKARHHGYDLYFVTQHPTFVDPYIRKLAEEHNHLMRPFGAKRAVVHSWKGVKDNCDKSRKDSLRSSFKHPKEVYTWYKSAEVHTHKLRLPPKIIAMFFIPVALIACIYGAYSYFSNKIAKAGVQPVTATGQIASGQTSPGPQKKNFEPVSFIPVIPDIPWSAPRYADLTQPTVAPRIVGCMIMRNQCKCMTQQGTYYPEPMNFCRDVVQNGIFNDFPDASSGSSQPSKEPTQARNEQPKPSPSAEKPAYVESGFNLPVTSVADKYSQKVASAPSGAMYVQGLPDSRVLLGNR
jgi:zona occludens toxin